MSEFFLLKVTDHAFTVTSQLQVSGARHNQVVNYGSVTACLKSSDLFFFCDENLPKPRLYCRSHFTNTHRTHAIQYIHRFAYIFRICVTRYTG